MGTNINVQQSTQRINVSAPSGAVAVENSGPMGPAGPAGEVTTAALNAGLALKPDLTAQDPTTGRLAIAGMELGDTGWRNITSLCDTALIYSTDNGWQLRRIGNIVYMTCIDSTFKSGVTNAQLFYTLTSGWRGPNSYSPLAFMDLSGGTYSGFFRSFLRAVPSYDADPWGIKTYETASTPLDGIRMSGTVNWITSDPWPSSLPGTQVTPPLS